MENNNENELNLKKTFIRFLKENNALKIFLINFYSQNGINFRKLYMPKVDDYNFFLTSRYRVKDIIDTFDWSQSKEGHEFWSLLNLKWQSKDLNIG